MNRNDELTLEITGFGTCGIARHGGFVIFAEGSCPGDRVKAKIERLSKNYAYARVLEVITPSPHRVTPFCVMQKVCGACQMQFIDYTYQLELKRQMVQDAMERIAGLDIRVKEVIPSPQIKEYRHKIQYPVSQKKVSKRLAAGYYKSGTHEIVDIKHCPIQPEICDEIIKFIREHATKYGISGYDEQKHNGTLRHVVLRSSAATGEILVTLVVNGQSGGFEDFAKAIFNEFERVSGVCINFNSARNNVILGKKSICAAGKDYIEEQLLGKIFKIGPNTFFQVNPKSAENIFKYVKDYLRDNFHAPVVLDAYAGIAAFGICVSDVCSKVVCVEENPQSCDLAKISVELNCGFDMNFDNTVIDVHNYRNNIESSNTLKLKVKNNIKIHNEDTGEFLAGTEEKFDAIILDPPRKGCTKETLDEVYSHCTGKIIYVSCNPATLARDLKYLTALGAKTESVQPFDMFCHTVHVETVAIISV